MKKAHIPLTKCFALSDFGWGSLCSALPGPQATGQRWVYMICYLLDHHTGGKPGQWDDGPANKKSAKLQAASNA
jgi:hypothetical protein